MPPTTVEQIEKIREMDGKDVLEERKSNDEYDEIESDDGESDDD